MQQLVASHVRRPRDLDSNGTLDTVVTNRNTNDVSMLLGTGVGTLGSPVNTTTV